MHLEYINKTGFRDILIVIRMWYIYYKNHIRIIMIHVYYKNHIHIIINISQKLISLIYPKCANYLYLL